MLAATYSRSVLEVAARWTISALDKLLQSESKSGCMDKRFVSPDMAVGDLGLPTLEE